jgi:hypothetical protein
VLLKRLVEKERAISRRRCIIPYTLMGGEIRIEERF